MKIFVDNENTSLTDRTLAAEIAVYPNPSNNNFIVSTGTNSVLLDAVRTYSTTGQFLTQIMQ